MVYLTSTEKKIDKFIVKTRRIRTTSSAMDCHLEFHDVIEKKSGPGCSKQS